MNARLTLRVPADVREALEKQARAEDLTVSQLVRRLVRKHQRKGARAVVPSAPMDDSTDEVTT